MSRLQILFKGAATFVAGTTGFHIPLLDIGVLAAASICFVLALRRSLEAAALGIAVVVGSVLWMANGQL